MLKEQAFVNVRDSVAALSNLTMLQGVLLQQSLIKIASDLGINPNISVAEVEEAAKRQAEAGRQISDAQALDKEAPTGPDNVG